MYSPEQNRPDSPAEDLSTAVSELEKSFAKLKKRISQIQNDTQLRSQLEKQQQQLKQEHLNQAIPEPIKVELKRIDRELEIVEQNLESRLLKWKDIIEPFWQALRFGGAGIILGWILKSLIA